MNPLDRILEAARARAGHVILPEGRDPRVREAAARIVGGAIGDRLPLPWHQGSRIGAEPPTRRGSHLILSKFQGHLITGSGTRWWKVRGTVAEVRMAERPMFSEPC